MHDPLTQAFQFNYPWPTRRRKSGTLSGKPYHAPFLTIWHRDPERRGNDDSCGWFKRAGHGDPKVLAEIIRDFEFDWDRTYSPSKQDHDEDDGPFVPKVYFCGLFCPDGDPHYSVHGIVLNLFFIAALAYFKKKDRRDWNRARDFMQKNLFEIMMFAENPTDSLVDGITRKFEIGCGEKQTKDRREDRIRRMAGIIYGWILRKEQKWWRHPRWHINHWEFQFHPWETFRRRFISRCCKCGARFKKGSGAIGTCWDTPCNRWFEAFRPQRNIICEKCGGYTAAAQTEAK